MKSALLVHWMQDQFLDLFFTNNVTADRLLTCSCVCIAETFGQNYPEVSLVYCLHFAQGLQLSVHQIIVSEKPTGFTLIL